MKVRDSIEFKKFARENETVLVDLFLPGCQPCKKMKETVLNQINTPVVYVDCSQQPDLLSFFEEESGQPIVSVPCLILYENGKIRKRNNGSLDLEGMNRFLA